MIARETLKKGHISARPKNTLPTNGFEPGIHSFHLDNIRDGFLYVPKNYNKDVPTPLAVMLHGAGGNAEHGLNLLKPYADEKNILLLAPASRSVTWDIIAKENFNGDIIFIDQALTIAFENYNVDRDHIAVGGFSDGASYGLCVGLSNGDLFTHIMAFSPGFYHTVENKGKPAVFISHGVKDHVLPIAPCSRRIVPRLKRLNYNIQYKEFQGEHEIPADISATAVNWFLET
ncbi:alpha/beta hydrolase [Segetibacter aerophilus]|uniref:Serine esterase n=1 Tax=Segetibacter aerophilus TaxID=670293 RepID=A0A512BJN6_9BACT|nr:phospholipase [Segetibacter aerophilus]GEO12181.1 serine esterase [Segetibacter aerophilus]